MAPRLEEEVVSQLVILAGNDIDNLDKSYLKDRLEALKELGFEIDDKRVNDAIKRYELRKKYKEQGKKKLKDRVKERAEEILNSYRDDPKFDSVKLSYKRDNICLNCNDNSLKKVVLKAYIKGKVIEDIGGTVIKRNYYSKILEVCLRCGHGSNYL